MKMFRKLGCVKKISIAAAVSLVLAAALIFSACGSDARIGSGNASAENPGGSAFGTISSEIPTEESVLADGKTVVLYFGDVQPEQSIREYKLVGELIDAARAAHPDADAALQCGDITNTGSAPEEWEAFFSAAAPALEGLPLFACPGNHESVPESPGKGGKPTRFLEAFALPVNGPEGYEEEYYSIDIGYLHIVSLSANYLDPSETYSADAEEAAEIAARIDAWIETDLANTDKPWKAVLMHQPAYPISGDGTAAQMRSRWIPIFDHTGVDIVLCGHQHEFTRTFPLKGGAEDSDGLVQLMANSSQKYYETSQVPSPEIAFEKGDMYGYYVITATAGKLSAEAADSGGRTVDYWEKTR